MPRKVRNKWLIHLLAGGTIAGLLFPIPFIRYWSLIPVCAFAIMKEIYDMFDDFDRSDVDVMDAVFTILGGVIVLVYFYWVIHL